MTIDIYQKSAELLEKLANSIYDRDPNNPKPFFFSLNEVHIVEKWLNELLNERYGETQNHSKELLSRLNNK